MQANVDYEYINFSTTSLEVCQNFYKSISSKAFSFREWMIASNFITQVATTKLSNIFTPYRNATREGFTKL